MNEQRRGEPMTVSFRIEQGTARHVRFTVFMGRGTRAHCGELTLDLEGFAWLVGLVQPILGGHWGHLPPELVLGLQTIGDGT